MEKDLVNIPADVETGNSAPSSLTCADFAMDSLLASSSAFDQLCNPTQMKCVSLSFLSMNEEFKFLLSEIVCDLLI